MLYESRDQIPSEYKWKLEDIIPSNEAWEELFFKCNERMGYFAKYQDKLGDDDTLYAKIDGIVKFERKDKKRKQVSIYPKAEVAAE